MRSYCSFYYVWRKRSCNGCMWSIQRIRNRIQIQTRIRAERHHLGKSPNWRKLYSIEEINNCVDRRNWSITLLHIHIQFAMDSIQINEHFSSPQLYAYCWGLWRLIPWKICNYRRIYVKKESKISTFRLSLMLLHKGNKEQSKFGQRKWNLWNSNLSNFQVC